MSAVLFPGLKKKEDVRAERLSGLSKCIWHLSTRITSFCVEAYEEFSGESDADDHFGFSLIEQALAEVGEGWIVPAGEVCDEEEDGADGVSAAADGSLACTFAAVIGDWSEADELGDGLVGDSADLGKVGEQDSDGAIGDAFDGPEGAIECNPEWIFLDQSGDLGSEYFCLTVEEGNGLAQAGHGLLVTGRVSALLLDGEIGSDLSQPCRERGELLLVTGRRRGW